MFLMRKMVEPVQLIEDLSFGQDDLIGEPHPRTPTQSAGFEAPIHMAS